VRAAAALAVVAAVILTAGCGGGEEETTVRVAAAASLQYALDELVEEFGAEHPSIRVEVSYGSSGALLQQLRNGAPFDVYLSAEESYPEQLVADGLVDPGDRFRYAVGGLVVWAGDGSSVDPAAGIEAVADARRVAIANPAHAPYGEAAVAAMRAAGVYERVADRLVLGESVAQAAEFVASGNAEVGIVARSQVLSPPLREVGRWQPVPPELYPPLVQGGAVLAGSAVVAQARTFRDYLTGAAGFEVLARYGFDAPAEG
jgi:molybdate transport system substrate-binding protein